jgi:hypothetical protein
MKIGVILDRGRLARWQAAALEAVADGTEFVVYSCESDAPTKRRLKHAFYYALNLVTVRNRLTRRVDVPGDLPVVARRTFRAETDGAWQSLPPDLLTAVEQDGPAVLVKFGMDLLKVPDQLRVPILSYHHGDSTRFRGRPAGFYELLRGEPIVGQIVQILSNKLDAGKIVAAAETKAVAHSYRETLVEAYRHSPLLLRTAIANAVEGKAWEPSHWGPADRLPGNATVFRFVFQRVRAWLSHLLYGLFREKRWNVATAAVPDPLTIDALVASLADHARWTPVATPGGYRFLADPFFHPDGGLLVEALCSASARGEVLLVTGRGNRRLSGRGGHFSYPAPIESAGKRYVVPEVSDWSAPLAYPSLEDGLGEPLELLVPGRPQLLDPTPFRHGDAIFLFGNVAPEGQSVLRLWVADTLDREFTEHPASPVRVSPNGARMAGTPTVIDGRLIRVGQDLRGGYGDGIAFFDVTQLDRCRYSERMVAEFRFRNAKGPHTLNLARAEVAFDYYDDAFSLLAGFRRFRQRRAARRIGD